MEKTRLLITLLLLIGTENLCKAQQDEIKIREDDEGWVYCDEKKQHMFNNPNYNNTFYEYAYISTAAAKGEETELWITIKGCSLGEFTPIIDELFKIKEKCENNTFKSLFIQLTLSDGNTYFCNGELQFHLKFLSGGELNTYADIIIVSLEKMKRPSEILKPLGTSMLEKLCSKDIRNIEVSPFLDDSYTITLPHPHTAPLIKKMLCELAARIPGRYTPSDDTSGTSQYREMTQEEIIADSVSADDTPWTNQYRKMTQEEIIADSVSADDTPWTNQYREMTQEKIIADSVSADDTPWTNQYREMPQEKIIADSISADDTPWTNQYREMPQEKIIADSKTKEQQGNTEAMGKLAMMHLNGDGVEKDEKEAAQLISMMALQGDALGQLWMGKLYYRGMDVRQEGSYRKKRQRSINAHHGLPCENICIEIG